MRGSLGPCRSGLRTTTRGSSQRGSRLGRQGGVLSRRQVYALGDHPVPGPGPGASPRWQRWATSRCACTRAISDVGHQWAAVFQGGPQAYLDGASALIAGGLDRFTVDAPPGLGAARRPVRRTGLYVIRQTRRWSARPRCLRDPAYARRRRRGARGAVGELRQAGCLCSRWPSSSGSPPPSGSAAGASRHAGPSADGCLHATVLDLLDGARSISEAEFAAECRNAGCRRRAPGVRRDKAKLLPRRLLGGVGRRRRGRRDPALLGDQRRRGRPAAQRRHPRRQMVLRLPLLGLRVAADDFFDQIEEALRAGGWPPRQDV